MALGRLKQRCLGCFDAAGLASQHRETKLFSFSAGDVPTKTMLIGMLRYSLDISATQKASVNIESRLPLLRAGGPVAEWRSFLFNKQGKHTRPASREARCRAAVKPRPSSMSVERPPRPMDAMWGQGALPLVRAMRPVAEWRSFLFNKQGKHTRPASSEARCRAAVKPRPSSMSPYAPARLWRAVRKGAQPPWMSTGRSVSWKGSVSPLRS